METATGRTVSYLYDAASNLTRQMTEPQASANRGPYKRRIA
jgi:hypothetical protein